jgi:hypothetical protein
VRINEYEYTQVTKKGTVTVTNFRKEKGIMRVSVSTGGQVSDVSDGGKAVLNDFRPGDWQEAPYHHINNHSEVNWELTLDPGQTKTVTYTVSFYVR